MACRFCWSGIRDNDTSEIVIAGDKEMELQGKKITILGERDGVPAQTIEQAIAGLGAEVVYSTTQCFV